MLRYTKILLILLIGGCIYGSSISELGYRSRTNIGSSGIEKSDQAYKPKQFKTNSRKGFTISSISRPKPQRSKELMDSGRDLRIRLGNSSSDVKYTTFLVTAYTKNDRGMNGKGVTASGKVARVNHTIAASRGIPLHTKIYFPELGLILTVEDRGGAIKGNRIDLYYGTDLKGAKRFGKRKLKGVVLK